MTILISFGCTNGISFARRRTPTCPHHQLTSSEELFVRIVLGVILSDSFQSQSECKRKKMKKKKMRERERERERNVLIDELKNKKMKLWNGKSKDKGFFV